MTDATIYMADSCPYSRLALNYFRDVGVNVRIVNIGKNKAERDRIYNETEQMGIPVIKLVGTGAQDNVTAALIQQSLPFCIGINEV